MKIFIVILTAILLSIFMFQSIDTTAQTPHMIRIGEYKYILRAALNDSLNDIYGLYPDSLVNKIIVRTDSLAGKTLNKINVIHGDSLESEIFNATSKYLLNRVQAWVDSPYVVNNGIGNEDLVANSVSTTEIRDLTIALGDMAPNSVDSTKVKDISISGSDLSLEFRYLFKAYIDSVYSTIIMPDTLLMTDGTTTYYRTVAGGLIEEGEY